MIKDYNPDKDFKDTHQVEITLQCWEYSKTFIVEMQNNLRGLEVVNYTLEKLDLDFYNKLGSGYEIELEGSNGDSLLLSDDEEQGEDWLKQYLVEYRVLKFNQH